MITHPATEINAYERLPRLVRLRLRGLCGVGWVDWVCVAKSLFQDEDRDKDRDRDQ
jgi:hypothetical protein